jgi:Transposase DDE domain
MICGLSSAKLHNHCAKMPAKAAKFSISGIVPRFTRDLRCGFAFFIAAIAAGQCAGIDFQQWFKWKENGIYFLSREKENMKLEILGIHLFDRADPINQGVISDEIVATSMGVTVRRVVYQDPETDIIYIYITNLQPSISPGIVALLYKARWDVEKVFDEFKINLAKANHGRAPRLQRHVKPDSSASPTT